MSYVIFSDPPKFSNFQTPSNQEALYCPMGTWCKILNVRVEKELVTTVWAQTEPVSSNNKLAQWRFYAEDDYVPAEIKALALLLGV